MTAQFKYNKHFAALVTVFVLGDSIIFLPLDNMGNNAVLGFLICAAVSLLLYPLALVLSKNIFAEQKNIFFKILFYFFSVFVGIYAFFTATECIENLTDFASKIWLPDTPKIIIALVFTAACLYFVSAGEKIELKFSIIAGAVVLITVLISFLLSFKDFNINNVSFSSALNFYQIKNSALPFIKVVALPTLLLAPYQIVALKKSEFKFAFLGIIFGLLLLGMCMLQPLMIFGTKLSSLIEYPLSAAIGTVTLGALFTRIDGIYYFLFFFTFLIKTTVSLKLSYKMFRGILGK